MPEIVSERVKMGELLPTDAPFSDRKDWIPGVIHRATDEARRMKKAGATWREILMVLARAGEASAGPGAAASILVVDGGGLLRNGASPSLPADYLAAIDRLKPDAAVGTCASAAATGLVVITPDFLADAKWSELRHLPLALGFVAAWSMPIKSADGKVLGTFGTYFRERRSPTREERSAIEALAAAAASILS